MKETDAEVRSWIVRVRTTVIQEVITRDCTEEAARQRPFSMAEDITTLETEHFEVIDVRENPHA